MPGRLRVGAGAVQGDVGRSGTGEAVGAVGAAGGVHVDSDFERW